jgi:hypothetical protein
MIKPLLKSVLLLSLSLILICFLSYSTQAQTKDSLLRIYNTQTIQSFGKSYIKGGKSLSFADLKPEFTSGVARDLYKKSKGN